MILLGIKTRKYVRVRDNYDPNQFDQDGVDPVEIPPDAPTHCRCCGGMLTPLRRLSGKAFCTLPDCLLAARLDWASNKRMVNLSKQGEEMVIVQPGDVIATSKRGVL